jgi:hypothetical protein
MREGQVIADLVLLAHATFILFVVLGLPAIWIGAFLRRRWCRNPWFRSLHLAAIGFVVAESLLGVACPLTVWEDRLRGVQQSSGFIERWVHAYLFWSAPPWIFTACYVMFGLAVLVTWLRIPPRWKH